MEAANFSIREARTNEFKEVGKLMSDVYEALDGFPSRTDLPKYYALFDSIGDFADLPGVKLLVAASESGEIGGTVIYCGDMDYYGSGAVTIEAKDAAAFRLLAVSEKARGHGLGKRLTEHCIELGKEEGNDEMIIHTTDAMLTAWRMYEKRGFRRSEDLDFDLGGIMVYGFRMPLA